MYPAAAGETDQAEQLAYLELKQSRILDKVDRQLQIVAYAASVLIDGQSISTAETSRPVPQRRLEITAYHRQRPQILHEGFGWWRRLPIVAIGALLLSLGLIWSGWLSNRYFASGDALSSKAAVNAVVAKIINVESNGDSNAKNSRSSATGPGQYINETWLDLIRSYRPDLLKDRTASNLLALRHDTGLVREITTRFVERHASMLRRRDLPVTPGTIYLAHFAGGAGAVAILSAPGNADAALVMAAADATGRTTRDQIIKGNPFLKHFTVADIKAWADRKMRGFDFHLTEAATAQASN